MYLNKNYKWDIMRTSANKKLGKNKFYNYVRGKSDKFCFWLPTIMISSKHFLSWDTLMFSIFIAVGRTFVQFNICEVIQNTDTAVYKETLSSLMECLRETNIEVKDGPEAVNFLKKNTHIVLLLKNANVKHHYIQNIIYNSVCNQSFVKTR